jgi:hypothetical protein
MPQYIKCSQTFCDGNAPKLGALCADCQKKADEQARQYEANKWKHAGWTRQSERDTHSKYKPK